MTGLASLLEGVNVTEVLDTATGALVTAEMLYNATESMGGINNITTVRRGGRGASGNGGDGVIVVVVGR